MIRLKREEQKTNFWSDKKKRGTENKCMIRLKKRRTENGCMIRIKREEQKTDVLSDKKRYNCRRKNSLLFSNFVKKNLN